MDRLSKDDSRGPRQFLFWATGNLILPVMLAWLLTTGFRGHLRSYDSSQVTPNGDRFGPVSVRVKLPGTVGGIPEPLVVCGRAGSADLVYIRILAGKKAAVGVEFWGLRADESGTFDLSSMDAVLDIKCYLPALFPEDGDEYWRELPPRVQRSRQTEYFIVVDNIVRLKGPVKYDVRPHSPIFLGRNPLGGSLVSDRFTGTILNSL